MGLIIDTSALVTMERRKGQASTMLAPYLAEPVVLPVIVWAELLAGVRLAKDPATVARRRAHLEQVRLHVPLMDFNAAIAEHYADIFAECMHAGTPIPQNDMAVAATARHLGYRVLVGAADEAHFRRVKNLDVVTLNPEP
jgi:tRNA(fMet)-specific endonuclease VapC